MTAPDFLLQTQTHTDKFFRKLVHPVWVIFHVYVKTMSKIWPTALKRDDTTETFWWQVFLFKGIHTDKCNKVGWLPGCSRSSVSVGCQNWSSTGLLQKELASSQYLLLSCQKCASGLTLLTIRSLSSVSDCCEVFQQRYQTLCKHTCSVWYWLTCLLLKLKM